MSIDDVPLSYLLTCSETSLRSFAANCCNQIAECKKARREIDDELLLWEGRRLFVERLIGSRAELFDMCRSDLRQSEFRFEPERGSVRRKAEAA